MLSKVILLSFMLTTLTVLSMKSKIAIGSMISLPTPTSPQQLNSWHQPSIPK